MITREEAKQNLCMNLLCSEAIGISWVADDFVIELIDRLFDQQYQLEQHIKSLEAQLSDAEQLTCDGCVEKDKWKFNHFPMQCEYCSMKPRKCYFQPKDTQTKENNGNSK